MADSHTSRNLPFVTRRGLLSTTASLLVLQAGVPDTAFGGINAACTELDPVLERWRKWRVAYEENTRLCKKRWRLEGAMLASLEEPHVEITLPGSNEPAVASSLEEIDRICGDTPDCQMLKAEAASVLLTRRKAWDRLSETLGYSSTEQAEIKNRPR